jgi:hypothetical protein
VVQVVECLPPRVTPEFKPQYWKKKKIVMNEIEKEQMLTLRQQHNFMTY